MKNGIDLKNITLTNDFLHSIRFHDRLRLHLSKFSIKYSNRFPNDWSSVHDESCSHQAAWIVIKISPR